MEHDYSGHERALSEDKLTRIGELAEEQLRRMITVASCEDALKKAQTELKAISEEALPELMQEVGMESFKLASGQKISINEKLRASIIAAAKGRAFDWLREQGHGALIKRVVSVQFGMGEDDIAEEAVALLGELPVEDNASVHNGTLVKFCNEALASGVELPDDLFSLHIQRVAVIK